MKTYTAPWGKILKYVSVFLVVLTVGWTFGASLLPAVIPAWSHHLTRWTLPVIVLGCLPFMVLGYEITEGAILIRRPLWKTRLPLAGLKSAAFVPKAMNRSLRTCGNCGGFSITGWYWKKDLGSFSAYVTDPERTVVLKFEKRTVVLSPGEPEDFVNELSKNI